MTRKEKEKQSVRFNVEAWVENLPVEDDLSNVYTTTKKSSVL